MQLFELFFDEEACELILQKTMLYAHSKGEDLFVLTISEFEVVFGISPVSGLVPVPCRRMFWRNSPMTRNEAVFNVVRRNRFEKILQMLHFADNPDLHKSDKYTKISPSNPTSS